MSRSPRPAGRLDPSALFTVRTPRVVAARKLQRRRDRDQARQFLADGPQAVREALALPAAVRQLFVTADGYAAHAALADTAVSAGVDVALVTDEAMTALSETVQPQGILAVCDQLDEPLSDALGAHPRLVVVLVDIRDPGNAGAILRTADAAGAWAVIFAGETVDPYNAKCVRSSAGSLFHLPIVRDRDTNAVLSALRSRGVQLLAASGYGDQDLYERAESDGLDAPTAWVFGSEAHGLSPAVIAAADACVRVPLYGRAESLNLAAAAAVCLYASASAQRRAMS